MIARPSLREFCLSRKVQIAFVKYSTMSADSCGFGADSFAAEKRTKTSPSVGVLSVGLHVFSALPLVLAQATQEIVVIVLFHSKPA